jgi:purine nucleosidase
VHCDPEAARIAFAAWQAAIDEDPRVPRALVLGLDVTERAWILPGDVDALAGRAGSSGDLLLDPDRAADPEDRSTADNPMIAFVADALRWYFEFHARYDKFYGAFIHDPLVTAVALDPSLARSEPAAVDVDTSGGRADGQTIADWRGLWGRTPNADVAVEADAAEFLRRLIDRVGALAAARGL